MTSGTTQFLANDVGRSAFRILDVRNLFKDLHAKLVNLPKNALSSATLLSRIVRPDPLVDHARSHMPELVARSMKDAAFRKNVEPLLALYNSDGVLRSDVDLSNIGIGTRSRMQSTTRDVQKLLFEPADPSQSTSRLSNNPRHQIFVDLESEEDVDNGMESEHSSEESSGTDDDDTSEGPIVISSDSDEHMNGEEDDDEILSGSSDGKDLDDVHSLDDDDDLDDFLHRPGTSSKKRKRGD